MDILSPIAAAVAALLEIAYQEETGCTDDYEPSVEEAWLLDIDLYYSLRLPIRHVRHQDSVQGIDIGRPTAWMLVRGTPSRHGAHVPCHLVPNGILI